MTMRQGEVAKIAIAGYKGYGASGFPAWGYPLYLCVCIVSAVLMIKSQICPDILSIIFMSYHTGHYLYTL